MTSVVVSPYSDEWPTQFLALQAELLTVFASINTAIEHIGSTAVPGLAAKPVIDVLLGAPSLADIELKTDALCARGYTYVAKYDVDFPSRRYFVRPPTTSLRVHLHAVEQGSPFWREQLAFRDLLRADTSIRGTYQDLKFRLAAQFADDKAAYTDAKGPFIRSVLANIPGLASISSPDHGPVPQSLTSAR